MPDPSQLYNEFQSSRAAPVETTIWQIEVTIIAMKLEQDGDYHLVLQGSSGETMIGEIPTPSREFIGDSPWFANVQAARRMVDDRFVRHLAPAAFVPLDGKLVPRESIAGPLRSLPQQLPPSFLPAAGGDERAVPLFKTQVPATRALITRRRLLRQGAWADGGVPGQRDRVAPDPEDRLALRAGRRRGAPWARCRPAARVRRSAPSAAPRSDVIVGFPACY